MIKKKFSFEKAVDIILNDEYEDNMIFQHLDYQLSNREMAKVSGNKSPKRPRPKTADALEKWEQNNGRSHPKPVRNFKKRQIFDDDEPIHESHVQQIQSRGKVDFSWLIFRGHFEEEENEIEKKIAEK